MVVISELYSTFAIHFKIESESTDFEIYILDNLRRLSRV